MAKKEKAQGAMSVSLLDREEVKDAFEKYGKAYLQAHEKEDELNAFLKDFKKSAGGSIDFLSMTEEQSQTFTTKQTALKRSTSRMQSAMSDLAQVLYQAGYEDAKSDFATGLDADLATTQETDLGTDQDADLGTQESAESADLEKYLM